MDDITESIDHAGTSGASDCETETVEPMATTASAKPSRNPNTDKKNVAGIIYLSTIPPGMNVKAIREYFSQFGEINRTFLQPEGTETLNTT